MAEGTSVRSVTRPRRCGVGPEALYAATVPHYGPPLYRTRRIDLYRYSILLGLWTHTAIVPALVYRVL
eukprot:2335759-Rhodomonas_salina.2